MQTQSQIGVLLHRAHQGPLVSALGHPQAHGRSAQPAQPGLDLVGILRQLGHQDLARDPTGVLQGAVDLLQQRLDHLRTRGVRDLLHHPAALAADPPLPHMEDLDGGLELVLREREDVRLSGVRQHHGIALEDASEGGDVIPTPGGVLVPQIGHGLGHLLLQTPDVLLRIPGHEVAEVLSQCPVVHLADPTHARCGALVDVAHQTGSAGELGAAEHSGGAGAHGEDPQHQVHGLADRLGWVEGTEVLHALALVPAHHHHPGVRLVHGHGQVRVGLVVPVHDVEPRRILLDPGVLQLQRLQLRTHHGPLHGRGGVDHGAGLGVQP